MPLDFGKCENWPGLLTGEVSIWRDQRGGQCGLSCLSIQPKLRTLRSVFSLRPMFISAACITWSGRGGRLAGGMRERIITTGFNPRRFFRQRGYNQDRGKLKSTNFVKRDRNAFQCCNGIKHYCYTKQNSASIITLCTKTVLNFFVLRQLLIFIYKATA